MDVFTGLSLNTEVGDHLDGVVNDGDCSCCSGDVPRGRAVESVDSDEVEGIDPALCGTGDAAWPLSAPAPLIVTEDPATLAEAAVLPGIRPAPAAAAAEAAIDAGVGFLFLVMAFMSLK